MNKPFCWATLILSAAVTLAAPAGAQSSGLDLYQQARLELVRGNLDSAIVILADFRRANPGEGRLAEARYWEAFARYRRNENDDLAQATALLAVEGGGRPHPDAPALANRVMALRGDAPPTPPRCTVENGTAFAEALPGAATGNRAAVELIAAEALAATDCPVVGRRAALALLGRSSATAARYAVRSAAIGDEAPQVRSDALTMLSGDTAMGSLRLVAMVVRRDTSRLVIMTAADVLSRLNHPATADTVMAVVMDSFLPPTRQQAVLSWSRFEGRAGPSAAELRRAFPVLVTRGALGATVIEYVAARGGEGDRDWIWSQVGNTSLPTMARLTGLQQVGGTRSVAELRELFDGDTPQLLRFGVLEQLREHRDTEATRELEEIVAAERAGVMRDAAQAALDGRGGGVEPGS